MGKRGQEKTRAGRRMSATEAAIDLWKEIVGGLFARAWENAGRRDLPGALVANLAFNARLMERFVHDVHQPPSEALGKFIDLWGKEWADFQRLWLGKTPELFTWPETGKSPGDGRDLFRAWSKFYEGELKPLLNIPQVGLARFYQEKANCLMDKFHSLQRASAEFLEMLAVPMDESLRMLRKEMDRTREASKISEGLKEAYGIWINNLEKLYQNLFRSPDFIKCLSSTVSALAEFVNARMEYVQQWAKAAQLPTIKDLDEAYRELYLLKREVRSLRVAGCELRTERLLATKTQGREEA